MNTGLSTQIADEFWFGGHYVLGMMTVRGSFDITSKGRHGWNGFWRRDTPHDVIVGMGRRDDIVVIALLA